MREGPNLLKLARKEQCMALLSQLRTKFKLDGRVYRVFPSGEVQYLHPKDGVYPEKVNKGRVGCAFPEHVGGGMVDLVASKPLRKLAQ
jgi:photosystem I subunit 2